MEIKSFEQWYEANKESLSQLTHDGLVKRAFEAGYASMIEEREKSSVANLNV